MANIKAAMTGTHYIMIAEIINKLPPDHKKVVADHFATEFRKRIKAFDPLYWERYTGGKIQGYDIKTGKFIDGSQ